VTAKDGNTLKKPEHAMSVNTSSSSLLAAAEAVLSSRILLTSPHLPGLEILWYFLSTRTLVRYGVLAREEQNADGRDKVTNSRVSGREGIVGFNVPFDTLYRSFLGRFYGLHHMTQPIAS